MLLDHPPVFTIHLETLEETFVLVIGPATSHDNFTSLHLEPIRLRVSKWWLLRCWKIKMANWLALQMLQGWDNFRWSWHWFTAALMMDSGLADCMFNLFGVFNLPLFGWKRCGKISGLIILSQRCSLLLVHILVYSYWFSLIGRLWRCRSYHLLIWIVSDLGWALLGRKVLTTDYIFFFICFTTSHHETVVFLIGSE